MSFFVFYFSKNFLLFYSKLWRTVIESIAGWFAKMLMIYIYIYIYIYIRVCVSVCGYVNRNHIMITWRFLDAKINFHSGGNVCRNHIMISWSVLDAEDNFHSGVYVSSNHIMITWRFLDAKNNFHSGGYIYRNHIMVNWRVLFAKNNLHSTDEFAVLPVNFSSILLLRIKSFKIYSKKKPKTFLQKILSSDLVFSTQTGGHEILHPSFPREMRPRNH